MGLAYKAMLRLDQAQTCLERAQTGNNGRSYFHLALLYAEHDGSREKAMNLFAEAHRLNPHDSDILYERGELRYKMGQLEGCVNDKRKALQVERASMGSTLNIDDYEVI